MKIYLASRFSRREEMCSIRTNLQALGHIITSRWLDEETTNPDPQFSEVSEGYKLKCCMHDIEDVHSAECVVSFTEQPGNGNRGGRHVEYGLGLAWNKRLVIVGPRENVFYYYPLIELVSNENELYDLLGVA